MHRHDCGGVLYAGARVRGPDTMQAAALVGVVESFSYTKICILHRDDDYGTQGAVETRKDEWVLSLVDKATKLKSYSVLDGRKAIDAAQTFFVNWISRFGAPARCKHDRGPEFVGPAFTLLQDSLGTLGIATPAIRLLWNVGLGHT